MSVSGQGQANFNVLQFAADTATCPSGTWLLHLTCVGTDAESDLSPCVSALLSHAAAAHSKEEAEQALIYSLYFNTVGGVGISSSSSNLHFCSPPGPELGYSAPVQQARRIFSAMYPDEELMP